MLGRHDCHARRSPGGDKTSSHKSRVKSRDRPWRQGLFLQADKPIFLGDGGDRVRADRNQTARPQSHLSQTVSRQDPVSADDIRADDRFGN